MSQSILFQRYGTKRWLFFAAKLPQPPELGALLGDTPLAGKENTREYLRQLSARLLAWIDAAMPGSLRAALHPDFPNALQDAHGSHGPDALLSALAELFALLQKRSDLGDGAPTDLASTLLELLHG